MDDTNTITVGFNRYLEDRLAPPPFMKKTALNYQQRRSQPSDYEALVSHRPIGVHALEHLGDTDRGVILFRKLVREGIK